jgi:hypothetical protein
MGIKSWLFGKDRGKGEGDDQTEALATLKKQLNTLEVQGKNLRRKSEEQKTLARQMLKEGNKIGAKQALTRSNIYLQKYNKLENMKLNLSSQIDVIQEAGGYKETQKGTKAVDRIMEDVTPLDVERTMAEMEDQRDRLDMMSESLADTTAIEMNLEGDFMDNIDDQLAAMELEIQSEAHGDLPEPGTKTTSAPATETEDKEDVSDLEKELQDLEKELSSSEE